MNLPVHPDELTAPWLTEILRASGAVKRASVVAFAIEPMSAEKGITGHLVRLYPTYDDAEPAAPASLVAKFSGLDAQLREIVHSMGFYEREVRFYRELAARTPIHTPTCYFADIDVAEGHSLILLEDLAPGRNGSWVAGSSIEEVELAVTEIAKVHAAWWRSPILDEKTWLNMTGMMSASRVQPIFDHTWPSFLDKLLVPASRQTIEVGELLHRHLEAVNARLLETPPRTLIHHDYDADNLFFIDAADSLGLSVIDWQMTTGGRPGVDIAWLIGGQCEPRMRRENEEQLLRRYHSLLLENGVHGYAFEQCWDDYRLAMLLPAARIAVAVGVSQTPSDGHGGFWDVVFPRYCQAIEDLEVAELLKTEYH